MHLPPATERLWQAVQAAPQLRSFVLIGGTALALRIGHRLSEDLDFMHVLPGALPRGRIRQLRESLEASGWIVRANPSPALIAEFGDSGKDWADYQQDYIAHDPAGGTVKLTFVVAEPENLRCLDDATHSGPGPRLAEIEELFRLKCIAAADRTKSRDWLDLYLLLSSGSFNHVDFIEAFSRAAVPQKRDIALMPTPPTIPEMTAYFQTLQDKVQQELAARGFGQAPCP